MRKTLTKNYKNQKWLKTQYIDKKKSTCQIGKDCNVFNSTICYWLKKFSILIRSESERQKDRKHSDEIKKRISKTLKNRKLSDEIKKKMSEAHTGKKLSEETKKKISESEKGKKYQKKQEEKYQKQVKEENILIKQKEE